MDSSKNAIVVLALAGFRNVEIRGLNSQDIVFDEADCWVTTESGWEVKFDGSTPRGHAAVNVLKAAMPPQGGPLFPDWTEAKIRSVLKDVSEATPFWA